MSGFTVVLEDGAGKVQSFPANNVGNFFGTLTIGTPFMASVSRLGASRKSTTAHTSAMGDCNTCHSQDGANGALGRLIGP